MATVAIYVRVSTEEQAERGYSLRDQEDACRRYAAERLGCSDPIVVRDEGISGSILERPGIQQLLAMAKDLDYVVCKDPDRLARNLVHQLIITERIERKGAKLVFLSLDRTPTPEGQLFYAIRGAISEFERAKITERLMSGKIRKAKEGGIPTRVVTYGYRQNGKLEIDEAEAQVVRQIYDWFLNGFDGHVPPVAPGAIARRLNELGVPTKQPGGKWGQATVRRILLSPTYAGRWYYRKTDQTGQVGNRFRPPEERVSRRTRDPSEWVEVPIPAIIPPEQWERAQEAYRLSTRMRARKGPYRTYLLTGVAVCGRCGRHVVGWSQAKPGRPRAYYYGCASRSGQGRTGNCGLPYVHADEVEAAVWEQVQAWLEHPEFFRACVEELARSAPQPTGERQTLEDALAAVRDERVRLLRLYQKALVPEEEVERILIGLRQQEAALLERLAALPPEGSRSLESPEDMVARLRPLAEVAQSTEEKRRVVQGLIERVVFQGKTPDGKARIQIFPRSG